MGTMKKHNNKTNESLSSRTLPKSSPKPIAKKQLNLLKFGNYFSKSPKLTNNRIKSNKCKNEEKQNEHPKEGQLYSNLAGTGLMAQKQRDHVLNDNQSVSTINSEVNIMPTKAPSVSAKYKELLKEYVDTESTVSSSDIRDDVSSVASDEPSSSWKRPPRNAPPPPPHARPPPLPLPRRGYHKNHKKIKP